MTNGIAGAVTAPDRTTRRYLQRLGILTLAILTALTLVAAPAAAAADHSTRPVVSLADLSVVGNSTMVRTDRGVSVTLETTALTPGDVVSLWWTVFDNPTACTAGIPGVSWCGEPDTRNAAARPSVLHAAGRIIDEDGTARYGAHLRIGDTSGALFGPGLLAPRDAEVILVLRSHGPKIPNLVSEMLHTFGAGCNDAPPGTGTPGPNDCAELQVSAHSS